MKMLLVLFTQLTVTNCFNIIVSNVKKMSVFCYYNQHHFITLIIDVNVNCVCFLKPYRGQNSFLIGKCRKCVELDLELVRLALFPVEHGMAHQHVAVAVGIQNSLEETFRAKKFS